MAHELMIENGKAAMFYVDEVPWHKLGTKLSAPPTSAQAIRAARLDWRVIKAPLYVASGYHLHEVPHRHALVREDHVGKPDCAVFGIAGAQYQPLQNHEAFEFFDPYIQDGNAVYETAGALGDGQRVWILAKLHGELQIQDGDNLMKYVLLSNSHDGRSSLQVKLTPVRVVCQNTLTLALSQGGTIRIPHNRHLTRGLDRARNLIDRLTRTYDDVEQACQRMAARAATLEQLDRYLAAVFPLPAHAGNVQGARAAMLQQRLARHLALHGRGNERNKGPTVWTAYNGVTDLIDHRKATRLGADNSSKRLQTVWFGRGAAIKAKAFTLAKEWTQGHVPA
jgi:phage/plasmid-like protein (TIGR03299 family)